MNFDVTAFALNSALDHQERTTRGAARAGASNALRSGAERSRPSAEPADTLHISAEARAMLQELQARDAEVRAHENAHASAAMAGPPSYQYQRGPDGKLYAVGGEVPIQVKAGGSPEETLRNAQQVRAAALAPAQPSSADVAVASQAAALETKARAEQAEIRLEEMRAKSQGPEEIRAEQAGRPAPEDMRGEPTDPMRAAHNPQSSPVVDAPRFVDFFA